MMHYQPMRDLLLLVMSESGASFTSFLFLFQFLNCNVFIECSNFPSACRGEKDRPCNLELVNISCICQLSC